MDFTILKELCSIPGASGNEGNMKDYVLNYIKTRGSEFKSMPVLIEDYIQDCVGVVLGKPELAIFAHMDSTGFMVRYQNQLIPIGSPGHDEKTRLVGEDSLGLIECGIISDEHNRLFYDFPRAIDRGTNLTFKPDFRLNPKTITSPYLDNRLGVWAALELLKVADNAIIFFSTWEEHGGGSAAYLAKIMHEKYGVTKALIADVTWITDGIRPNDGVVISIKDHSVPRRKFVKNIIALAENNNINFQIEVEDSGSSDGGEIQKQPYPIDWCFIGPPVSNVHSKKEKVEINDVSEMISLYKMLLENSNIW